MAEFSNLVITKTGQELLAKIISGADGVRFTKIRVTIQSPKKIVKNLYTKETFKTLLKKIKP